MERPLPFPVAMTKEKREGEKEREGEKGREGERGRKRERERMAQEIVVHSICYKIISNYLFHLYVTETSCDIDFRIIYPRLCYSIQQQFMALILNGLRQDSMEIYPP